MRRTAIINAVEVNRITFKDVEEAFMKHCKIRNLSPQTLAYYEEDLSFFHANVPVRYIDEITQGVFENFIVAELDAEKKVTSLNL